MKFIGQQWKAAGLNCFQCICCSDGTMECVYTVGIVTSSFSLFRTETCVSYKCIAALKYIRSSRGNKTNTALQLRYQCSECYNEGKIYYLFDKYTAGNHLNDTFVFCSCQVKGWSNCRVSFKIFDDIIFQLECSNCTTNEAINIFYPRGR